MSRAPARRPPSRTPAKSSRSLTRRRSAERERARRRASRSRTSRPDFLALRVKDVLRRVPTAAWLCALVAFLNAAAWSVITPAFQGRDEIAHFAYTAQLAETGALPTAGNGRNGYPRREELAMAGLHYWQVRYTSYAPAISSIAEQKALMEDVGSGIPFEGSGEAAGASREPPLFYALQVVPYALGGGNVLVQLQLMRLLSALLGAITALLCFLFLREILPSMPWAASVGAICVALQPQFAFVSGSDNPDALIYAISAGVFLCLAYAFRRSFTRRLAIALGLLLAAGFATYFSFTGVAGGALVGVAILAVRGVRAEGRRALVSPVIAVCTALAPGALYAFRNLAIGRPLFGLGSSDVSFEAPLHELSYIWQMYLPRLPGMTHYFEGITTWRQVWFDRLVGLYGWMDTPFPLWVDDVALGIAGAIALLCVRELVARRSALRARVPELGSYVAIALGVLLMLGIASYYSDRIQGEVSLGEPRYLLPILPLLGAALALAVRGAGRRWMPVAGAAMVALFLGHDLFSQLQVVARYYG